MFVLPLEQHSIELVVALLDAIGADWHHSVYWPRLAADELSLSAALVLESRSPHLVNALVPPGEWDSSPYLV